MSTARRRTRWEILHTRPLNAVERGIRRRILRADITVTDRVMLGRLVVVSLMHGRPDLHGVGVAGIIDESIRWSA